jgi:Putative Flp pilus-assembly TadE/G-like
MNKRFVFFTRRLVTDQRGQVLPWLVLGMTMMVGATGMSIDVGHAYVVHAQLQNDANAAALAAAGQVYVTQSQSVNSTTQADLYSGSSGGLNVDKTIGTVNTTVTTVCLNSLEPSGTTCGSSGTPNAVKVKETTTVPTWLLGVLGIHTIPVAASATASMGGLSNPWNVAIIVDSTGSMASVDNDCGSLTEFQCALSGIQALLASTNPCPAGVTTCSGSTAKIGVSLFTFPPILTKYNGTTVNSVSDEINCNGTPASWTNYSAQPIAAPYSLPIPGASLPGAPNATYMTYTTTSAATSPNKAWNATYQVTPFLSDYYLPSSTSTGGLNTNSNLVKAVGYANTSGCLTYTFGIWGTGSGSGFGNTYLASAIYSAQAALVAEQAAVPGSKNALIFLSDGQANASYYSENTSAYGTANSTNQYAQAYEFPMGPKNSEVGPTSSSPSDPVPPYYTPATAPTTYAYNTLGVNGKGIYPDWYDQCQQGIVAAQYASTNGTVVYSVAYGSEDSGCSSGWNIGLTDTTLVATGQNAPFTLSGLTPCVTMENIASTLSNFYSDYNQSGSGSSCEDASHTVTSLKDIFIAIASTFSTPRLIPNSAT